MTPDRILDTWFADLAAKSTASTPRGGVASGEVRRVGNIVRRLVRDVGVCETGRMIIERLRRGARG